MFKIEDHEIQIKNLLSMTDEEKANLVLVFKGGPFNHWGVRATLVLDDPSAYDVPLKILTDDMVIDAGISYLNATVYVPLLGRAFLVATMPVIPDEQDRHILDPLGQEITVGSMVVTSREHHNSSGVACTILGVVENIDLFGIKIRYLNDTGINAGFHSESGVWGLESQVYVLTNITDRLVQERMDMTS